MFNIAQLHNNIGFPNNSLLLLILQGIWKPPTYQQQMMGEYAFIASSVWTLTDLATIMKKISMLLITDIGLAIPHDK